MIAALRGSRLLLAVAPVVGATAFARADPDRSDLRDQPQAPMKTTAAKAPPSKAASKVDSKLIPAKEL